MRRADIQPKSGIKRVDRYLSDHGVDVEALTPCGARIAEPTSSARWSSGPAERSTQAWPSPCWQTEGLGTTHSMNSWTYWGETTLSDSEETSSSSRKSRPNLRASWLPVVGLGS